MQSSTLVGVVRSLVVVLAACAPRLSARTRGEPPSSTARAPAECRDVADKADNVSEPPSMALSWSPAPPSTSLIGDCPASGCGVNGMWLGDGVEFRTLHLDTAVENREGLSIRSFMKGNQDLQFQVERDEVIGVARAGNTLAGPQLIGAELVIASDDLFKTKNNPPRYTFRIEGFRRERYWSECQGGADCSRAPIDVPIYRFSAVNRQGCHVEVCKPGMTSGYRVLTGEAVIFRGDYYDEKTFEVRDQPNAKETDEFNIACLGTTISKLHLLRHTTASQAAGGSVGVAQRETMLRLLTADYCGVGHPFTENGHPLRLDFKNPEWAPVSGWNMATSTSIDAVWTRQGASCIGLPRLANGQPAATADALLRDIERVCIDHGGRMPPRCPSLLGIDARALEGADLAVSGNPPTR
jgi:ADYC domain